ncbi:MAG: ABC transporter permease [Hungatella sp.]|nr:ABC transporter permease [Hungatella sp.]
MGKYIGKRIISMIPVLLGVSLIIFTILSFIPGDPARMILGDEAEEEAVQELRDDMGLNDPFVIRYVRYVKDLLKGDMGVSYVTNQPVSDEVFSRYPTTITLATVSTLVAVLIAIPIGILSAIYQNTLIDNVSRVVAMIGVSMPNFWQGLLNILVFSVYLKWLPSSGFSSPAHWVLPALTIGTSGAAAIMRTTRSSMLETIRQDYIRTARAKGASETTVIWKHALRNALIPVMTVVGLRFGGSLGGSVVSEQVFSIPGLGKLMIDSINNRNYPVILGGVLLIAFAYGIINLVVDILYAFIDPRIKSQYSSGKKLKKHEGKGE